MSKSMQKLIKKLTADKKQFFVMVGLLMVMLLLWGRLLLKQVPQTAVADPATQVAAAADPDQAEQEDDTIVLKPTVYVDLPTVAKRDVFLFDKVRYPLAETPNPKDDRQKQDEETADQIKQQLRDIREWVDSLELQGTTLGRHPTAMINNRIYRLGEKINDFKIVRIEPRQIVMHQGDIEVVLPMSDEN